MSTCSWALTSKLPRELPDYKWRTLHCTFGFLMERSLLGKGTKIQNDCHQGNKALCTELTNALSLSALQTNPLAELCVVLPPASSRTVSLAGEGTVMWITGSDCLLWWMKRFQNTSLKLVLLSFWGIKPSLFLFLWPSEDVNFICSGVICLLL